MVRKFGIKGTVRMERLEAFADKVKKKYTTADCWHLFSFVPRKESREVVHSTI